MNSSTTKTRSEIGNLKREQTQQLLIAAAMKCFARIGVATTKTNDICKAASVSRGTFYNYFTDMDDLIISVFQKIHDDVDVLIHNPAKDIPRGPESLAVTIRWFFQKAHDDKILGKLFLYANEFHNKEKFEAVFKNKLEEDIKAAQNRGFFDKDDIDVEIATDVIKGITYRGIQSIIQGNKSPSDAPLYVKRMFMALGMNSAQLSNLSSYISRNQNMI